jgi:hypothetical protein
MSEGFLLGLLRECYATVLRCYTRLHARDARNAFL